MVQEGSRARGRAIDTQAVVVGAGPAGLAVAACLKRAGVSQVLLEREAEVGSAWRRHYDRLHLHTHRRFSALPFHPMPRSYPPYPSRAQVVEYLEGYSRLWGLTPRFGVEVCRIERDASGWLVRTSDASIRSSVVVLATGANGKPKIPAWEGIDTFPGTVIHSSAYRNGAEFANHDVLVVGFGNSGGEIALDLAEHGARPVVAVRSPVNIIPRDILGIPVLAIAVPLAKLPARLADFLIWPILKAYYPSLRRLGLCKATSGPFRQIEERGRIPLLDVGTVSAMRSGRIQVEGDVVDVAASTVRFRNGRARHFDAIVLATGYRPLLPEGVNSPPGTRPSASAPGLYSCGFHVSPTGMLREIAMEAKQIAAHIAAHIARSGVVSRTHADR